MLIYDCEIKNAIPEQGGDKMKYIRYCNGWSDFRGMGIACIAAYDYTDDRYRVFCEDNFAVFQALADTHKIIIGFNSIGFDNRLCAENGLRVEDQKSYDILVKIWKAAGLGPVFESPSHCGFSLDAVCRANFGAGKTGHGTVAPVLWQAGRIGEVIDYCINDVRLTKRLFDQILRYGWIVNPRDPSKKLRISQQ